MRTMILFLFTTLSLSAHARLTVVCEGYKYASGDKAIVELAEKPLNFAPSQGNEHQARASVELQIYPEYIFDVTVTESLDGDKVDWYTEIAVRSKASGNVVKRGPLWITLLGKNHSSIACSSFDKTETKTVPPQATEAREAARRNICGA